MKYFSHKCLKLQIFKGLLSSFVGEEAGDQWETISAALFQVNFYIFTCICICVCISICICICISICICICICKSSKDCYNVELRLVGEKKLINGSQIQGKEGKNKIN